MSIFQFEALLTGRWITDLANASSWIFHSCEGVNWAGFYLAENETLYLGPFQGKPACTEISFNRGVCGKSARERKTILVEDVHTISDHIVCDPLSRSELVVPLIHPKTGELLGVLDLDSPRVGRFTEKDQLFFEELVRILLIKGAEATAWF